MFDRLITFTKPLVLGIFFPVFQVDNRVAEEDELELIGCKRLDHFERNHGVEATLNGIELEEDVLKVNVFDSS